MVSLERRASVTMTRSYSFQCCALSYKDFVIAGTYDGVTDTVVL